MHNTTFPSIEQVSLFHQQASSLDEAISTVQHKNLWEKSSNFRLSSACVHDF